MTKKLNITPPSNPALQYITPPTYKEEKLEVQPTTSTGYTPARLETKSKRMQILIQPSLHALVKAKADSEGRSWNDTLHIILREYFNA